VATEVYLAIIMAMSGIPRTSRYSHQVIFVENFQARMIIATIGIIRQK
jgi:hypothetical protein